MTEISNQYSSKSERSTRVKMKKCKKTVGITLPQNLVEKARVHRLNISRITEQALKSIIDYFETQNTEIGSGFLSQASFSKKLLVDRAGFEPAASALRRRRSYQTELPALPLPLRDVQQKSI